MGATDTTDDSDEPIHETTPSTKLVKLWLGLTLAIGLPVTGYLLAVPDAFGTEGFGGVAGIFAALLTIIGIGRYAIRWLVLRRTTYTVTDDSVRREYELLYRAFSRDLPLEMLRSVELSRSRTESLLGLGSVRMLTTGGSRSMGYLAFDNVTNPEELRDAIRRQRESAVQRDTDETPDDGWQRASSRERARAGQRDPARSSRDHEATRRRDGRSQDGSRTRRREGQASGETPERRREGQPADGDPDRRRSDRNADRDAEPSPGTGTSGESQNG